jgi:hypothetical protein
LELKGSGEPPPPDAERRIAEAARLWMTTYIQHADPTATVMTMMRENLIYPGIGAKDLERAFAAGGTEYDGWNEFVVGRPECRTSIAVIATLAPSHTDWPTGRCVRLQIELFRP